MMEIFSINYPAVACLIILAGMAIYHVWLAASTEVETTLLPSSFNILDGGQPVSIWSEKDVAVNCPMAVDQISCRKLIIGPKGVVQVREIAAERVEIRGVLQVLDRIEGREEIVVYSKVSAARADTRRLVLKRKAEASIQVVPATTEVVRGRKAHTQGFFRTIDEFRRAQAKGITQDRSPTSRVVAAAQVRVLRAPTK